MKKNQNSEALSMTDEVKRDMHLHKLNVHAEINSWRRVAKKNEN